MPKKVDKIAINNEALDRRVKLTKEDKELVRWLREEEQISYQKLANRFKVSKRLIIFTCKPETLEVCKKKRAERGGSKIYYNREENTKSMKEHRDYKDKLFKEGLIK